LENHLQSHEIRIGFWGEGKFGWVGKNWDISMKYLPETLVSNCIALNHDFGVELAINDAVHSFKDLFMRKIIVNNLRNEKRDVKLFFSHDFHVYGEDAGDTAMYEPVSKAIIHFKRNRYFLINGLTDKRNGFNQYATGIKESFGKEGTYKDAEDGVLEGNPIAQGNVDSVASFKLEIKPQSKSTVYYWISCGKNYQNVINLDSEVKKLGVEQLLLETENYWSAWVNKKQSKFNILPMDLARLYKRSLLVMRTHVDDNGAIIASCDSDVLQFNRDTYSYVWPRDAAYIAYAFDLAGFQEVTQLFFDFCNNVVTKDGYFNHKYSPDGSVGSSWHPLIDKKNQIVLPIQEDETALVLYSLWKHFEIHRDIEFIRKVYENLVTKPTKFLLEHIDSATGLPKPSYDMWEEKRGVFTSTVATVIAALDSAAKFAKVFYDRYLFRKIRKSAAKMKEAMIKQMFDNKSRCFIKAIYPNNNKDYTIDSSLLTIFTLGVFNPQEIFIQNTMEAVEKKLWIKTKIGGIARYENDYYHRVSKDYPGNPWLISTLWFARWKIAQAKSFEELKAASDLLGWTNKRALKSGILAEQINPINGKPISVSPLIWSHAEYVIAISEYIKKYQNLEAEANSTSILVER
jgi:GH15 family glucan-1,4-alpha-glucosidase